MTFVQIETHFNDINKYVTRCDYRLQCIIEEEENDWPSPARIANLSSGPPNPTTVSPILIPKIINQGMKNDKKDSNGPIVPINERNHRSVFERMTRRIDVMIHDYLCGVGLFVTAEDLKKDQKLEVRANGF